VILRSCSQSCWQRSWFCLDQNIGHRMPGCCTQFSSIYIFSRSSFFNIYWGYIYGNLFGSKWVSNKCNIGLYPTFSLQFLGSIKLFHKASIEIQLLSKIRINNQLNYINTLYSLPFLGLSFFIKVTIPKKLKSCIFLPIQSLYRKQNIKSLSVSIIMHLSFIATRLTAH